MKRWKNQSGIFGDKMSDKLELVMRVKYVIHVPYKVVALIGVIACDRIKAFGRVIVDYEGQAIPGSIVGIETFGKFHKEATRGQEVALALHPTPELRSIKKSYQEDTRSWVESSAIVYRRLSNDDTK